jgi:putative DNA primase/helicase
LGIWAKAHTDTLKKLKPEFPEQFSGRQRQVTKPLLAIADTIADGWPVRLRRALAELFAGSEGEDTSLKVELLADIKMVYDERGIDRLSSDTLVSALNEMSDHPWCEINHGKQMTARTLAKLLKPFRIEPRQIRDGQEKSRGYLKEDFEDSWARYLKASVPLCTGTNQIVPDTKNAEIASIDAGCTAVPDKTGGVRGRA